MATTKILSVTTKFSNGFLEMERTAQSPAAVNTKNKPLKLLCWKEINIYTQWEIGLKIFSHFGFGNEKELQSVQSTTIFWGNCKRQTFFSYLLRLYFRLDSRKKRAGIL